jgi:hypothetical protein
MAYQFLTDKDLIFKARQEILKILGQESDVKLEVAEATALAMVKQYIGHRYDTAAEFAKVADARDKFLIKVVIVIMLYDLYTQATGMKDIPTHRKEDYGDMVTWLTEVGRGDRNATLTSLITDDKNVDIRLNSQEQQTWEY